MSIVTVTVCSSEAKKMYDAKLEVPPEGAPIVISLVNPVFDVANPVVGSKLMPPALNDTLTVLASGTCMSVDCTLTFDITRSRVAPKLIAAVVETLTVWV